MRSRLTTVLVAASALTLAATGLAATRPATGVWTREEREVLRSLSIASLGALPPDPSNRAADDPRAASLGRALFFDARLSGNGKVSCGTCHVPALDFQDGKPLAEGVG